MKTQLILTAILIIALGLTVRVSATGFGSPKNLPSVTSKITGDYVEARTASVYAGGCHIEGEMVTTGHDAVLAWNFTSGSWNGVSLAGVRAAAAVNCDDNLGNDLAARHTELLIDSSATPAQVSAVADLLKTRDGANLGKITDIRRGEISFSHIDGNYQVSAPGFESMTVQPMPNDECCKQPANVWYEPLSPLDHRKVGFTVSASHLANTPGEPWAREQENSAFYGPFTF